MRATMPRFVEMERRYGSVIRGLRAAARARNAEARGTSGARWSLFLGFKDGIRTMVDALVSRLEGSINYGAEVVALDAMMAAQAITESTRQWRLGFRDGTSFDADAIVCAAPAFAIAPILQSINRELAGMLSAIGYASAATVNLAFAPRISRSRRRPSASSCRWPSAVA